MAWRGSGRIEAMEQVIKQELILDELKGYDIKVPLMPYIHMANWINKDHVLQTPAQRVVVIYRYVGQLSRDRYYYEFAGVIVE
jgi:hypothetical protein